jgi:DNA polymerase-1
VVKKRPPPARRSTDEEVLEKLAEDYPLPAKLLEHRSLAKLKGTYTDKLPQMVNPAHRPRAHHYAQAVAVTGRLSSNDPNLQNIPIRTPEGRRVREAFVAPPGHRDRQRRLLARSSCASWPTSAATRACCTPSPPGWTCTAPPPPRCSAWPVDQVSSEQRRYAKVINFGLIYGMSAFGLAKNLGIETKAAAAYIDRYFAALPRREALHGRDQGRRRQPGLRRDRVRPPPVPARDQRPNGPRRAGAERAAINAPMQGTAADLIKLAMVAVQHLSWTPQGRHRMIMQVHDELVFEVPESEVDWLQDPHPAPDGRRGAAEGAAAGRGGRGAELGRGALMPMAVMPKSWPSRASAGAVARPGCTRPTTRT